MVYFRPNWHENRIYDGILEFLGHEIVFEKGKSVTWPMILYQTSIYLL